MFVVRGTSTWSLCRHSYDSKWPVLRGYSTKSYDPLRILFCGSDDFSIASLRALHAYHLKQPSRIASIDVVCRPGKRVGRGLKKIREVPIKEVASALSLPIHEIDTFTGFRGPAPLHHTLLAGRTTTGVTLQTLHHKNFDHGIIISQTPPPGFDIPNPESCTVPQLLDLVAPKGAQLLVDGIKNGLFVPPLRDAGWSSHESENPLIHAAKIKPEDRHVDWANWTLMDFNRCNRVLGSLWSKALVSTNHADGNPSFQQKRVILTDIEEVDPPKGSEIFSVVPGLPFVNAPRPVEPKKNRALYVFTRDSKVLRVNQMKVEGEPVAEGLRAAIKARMFGDQSFRSGGAEFTTFRNPLT
ncbi:hypothetical protein N7462_006930 [Penicillium macrosclerotiorum]|uniref:uncharacterized protein n=1 Tax=Penicillium macrosclerotiorum TaxID=303699 RepID=UPI0025499585|nr:uncharacterized protein N7462_006930 [Penicillium macrosclerotiorum]KAJ5678686.1 hypothetical protein N7462_006930 [Penicillium macrosclerotiorum]